jgi:hypothetical protein
MSESFNESEARRMGPVEKATTEALRLAGLGGEEYEAKVTRVTFKPIDEPIFSEQAILIEIEDDAGGEFVHLSQIGDGRNDGKIAINPAAWPKLRDAIGRMVQECKP